MRIMYAFCAVALLLSQSVFAQQDSSISIDEKGADTRVWISGSAAENLYAKLRLRVTKDDLGNSVKTGEHLKCFDNGDETTCLLLLEKNGANGKFKVQPPASPKLTSTVINLPKNVYLAFKNKINIPRSLTEFSPRFDSPGGVPESEIDRLKCTITLNDPMNFRRIIETTDRSRVTHILSETHALPVPESSDILYLQKLIVFVEDHTVSKLECVRLNSKPLRLESYDLIKRVLAARAVLLTSKL